MMSESRRNRRKNKKNTYKQKNPITKKDKVIGISAMIGLFIAAVILIRNSNRKSRRPHLHHSLQSS